MANIFDFRMSLVCLNKSDECIAMCDKKNSEMKSLFENDTKNLYSNDIRLAVENILMQEKFNYMYAKNSKDKNAENLLMAQYKNIKDYAENHPLEKQNKYLLVTSGDIISSSLQYMTLSKAMNEGMTIKKYYEAALLQDKEFSYCLANMGQWLYHAPAIAGGGKKIGLEYFYKADENAKSAYEIYYANLLISQVEFENKNTQAYKSSFEKCATVSSPNAYVDFLSVINNAGYSLFYYILNKEKVEKELNL